ncbi:MAG: hypothetical protein RIQ79_1268 [Verrucomicrobiota bacterium]
MITPCRSLVASLLLCTAAVFVAPPADATSTFSELWGRDGEKWTTDGPLPDFSFAGYHAGEISPPSVPQVNDVKTFGATGDGVTDDTRAIQAAIDATRAGAVYLPPGRYLISDFLHISRSGVVLRGAGPEKSVLWFPRGLDAIHPREGKASDGRRASGYSFDGAFVNIEGNYGEKTLARVTSAARRGDHELRVDNPVALSIGQTLVLTLTEDKDLSLTRYLYRDDPGDLSHAKSFGTRMILRVVAKDGDTVRFDRPLRFETRAAWSPELRAFNPSVTESGVESLGFAFPATPYGGHFKESGYNAIELRSVYHCWVRDVVVHNGDLGVNLVARACTLDGVRLTADPARGIKDGGVSDCTGHHGIQLKHSEDNLVVNFAIDAPYIHDLTVEDSSGNVFARGRGRDLTLDHHKDTPYENLFTALDCGRGTRSWLSGGGAGLGRHSAGWSVFWNLRATRELRPPAADWGPSNLVLVGLQTAKSAGVTSRAPWIEVTPPDSLQPDDLHAAQLRRRLEQPSPQPRP